MSSQPERDSDPYKRENNKRQLRRFFDAQITQSIYHHFLSAADNEKVEDILLRATKEVLSQEMFSNAGVLDAYKMSDDSTSQYSNLAKRALNTYLLSQGQKPPVSESK